MAAARAGMDAERSEAGVLRTMLRLLHECRVLKARAEGREAE